MKLSILLFYRAIFAVRHFRILAHIVMVLAIAWWLGTLFLVIFQCSPINGAWDLTANLKGHCVYFGDLILGYEVSNIVVDIIILALPVAEIRKLHMKTSRKIAVSGIFLLGGL